MSVLPQDQVFQFLTDKNGNINMAGASTTATATFTFSNAIRASEITRLNMIMIDGQIRPQLFGGEAALTTGLNLRIVDDKGVVRIDYTDQQGIRNNDEFGLLAGVDIDLDSVANNDALRVRWTLAKATKDGGSHSVFLGPRWVFQCIRRDNLVGVTSLEMKIQGEFVT